MVNEQETQNENENELSHLYPVTPEGTKAIEELLVHLQSLDTCCGG